MFMYVTIMYMIYQINTKSTVAVPICLLWF